MRFLLESPPQRISERDRQRCCCMYSNTLDGKRLMHGAEMDGIEYDDSIDVESITLNECKFVDKQKQDFLG